MLSHLIQRERVGEQPQARGIDAVRGDGDTAAPATETTATRAHVLPDDLAIGVVVALLAGLAVWLDEPAAARIPLGIAMVLFLPGYAFVALLFPSRDGPDGIERLALSFGVSLGIVAPVALVIDYSPWLIDTNSVVSSLIGIVLVCSIAASFRRSRLVPSDRFAVSVARPHIPLPRRWHRGSWAQVGIFLLVLVLLVVSTVAVVRDRLASEAMTDFAIYNVNGEAGSYPRELVVGEAAEVQLSVTNREGREVSYRLVVAGSGSAVDSPPQFTLGDGQTWMGTIRFSVMTIGDAQPVRFELWRIDRPAATAPYRALWLVVDAHAASTPGTVR